ncbi:MAG: Gfo/Idh/MocA family oxidoreductase [Armatimonadetes bacterium]|jgi:predicted dehydrogenase|nr:Gfo/Idh/MocA family oxidoreductase [Armatimonadota bacterium]
MGEPKSSVMSRRAFLRDTGRVAAASALAATAFPHVHAAEDNTIRLALIGCGSRGAGAVGDAMSTQGGPLRLVAMADLFADRLNGSYEALKGLGDRLDVPEERRFVGLDAYKQAMDCLRPGDVVILATPPAFRWVHFAYAIEKGLHVFMEKPVSVDGPSTRKMLALAEQSVQKNLKVGVGLMCRHCAAREELYQRLRAGEAGEIITLRAYRMHDAVGFFTSDPKPEGISHLLYQIQRFHSFLWSGGGAFSDFYIHNIDECCWMKDAWPVEAQGLGARHYRGNSVDQNFDVYSVEYTFADGAKLFLDGRCMPGCHNPFASYAHGTKGLVTISEGGHGAVCRIYRGQTRSRENLAWDYGRGAPNPYQREWQHLVDAIRQNQPYNEAKRGAEASLATVMGRMACHTGQVVTWDQVLNHDHELAPDLDKLTLDSPAPLQPDADGRYPIPMPGRTGTREY